MSIFKQKIGQDYQTVAEIKVLLEDVEAERAADPDRDLRYELARAIEHVNRFALLDPEESRTFVEELANFEKVDSQTAIKIADLKPQSRDELRSVYAHERYALDGTELDDILDVVARYL
jgi:DNA-directed RNA polymerase subunit F